MPESGSAVRHKGSTMIRVDRHIWVHMHESTFEDNEYPISGPGDRVQLVLEAVPGSSIDTMRSSQLAMECNMETSKGEFAAASPFKGKAWWLLREKPFPLLSRTENLHAIRDLERPSVLSVVPTYLFGEFTDSGIGVDDISSEWEILEIRAPDPRRSGGWWARLQA